MATTKAETKAAIVGDTVYYRVAAYRERGDYRPAFVTGFTEAGGANLTVLRDQGDTEFRTHPIHYDANVAQGPEIGQYLTREEYLALAP